MKFAICNETWQNTPIETVCAAVKSHGYDGIEIAPFTLKDDPSDLTEADAQHVAKVASDAGLEVVGLHWLLVKPPGLHITTDDDAVRDRTTEFLKHLAHLCKAMGGRVMVFGSPKQRNLEPGVTYEHAFDRAAEVFRAVSETAGPLGVTLALEPLGPEEGDFMVTADETEKIIAAVDHPACRLHLDVKAMSTESDPIPQVIRDHADTLAHFHANDPNRRGPGTGKVTYEPIVSALHDASYDGFVSVEVFDYTPDADTIARDSIAYLRQVFAVA